MALSFARAATSFVTSGEAVRASAVSLPLRLRLRVAEERGDGWSPHERPPLPADVAFAVEERGEVGSFGFVTLRCAAGTLGPRPAHSHHAEALFVNSRGRLTHRRPQEIG